MGEIYHARYEGVAGFEKGCIIKKIRRELASDKTFVDRFLNEGRMLVTLTHSNIVQIFDMGVVDGEYYLAMEYVDGADLRVLLRRLSPGVVPLSESIAVVLEILRGLSYAHRSKDSAGRSIGIVHGDVSPSNVLISKEGEVKLIDFGIARPSHATTPESKIQGKLAYMSPEQTRGDLLDCRTDIFSTGIVLYEMLTGRRPFSENAQERLSQDYRYDAYLPVSQVIDVPDERIDVFLARALAPDCADRYACADDFFDDLVEYARTNDLISGQREVLAFFKPYLLAHDGAWGMSGSADEVMSAALEEMLGAQSFGMTRTRTLLHDSGKTPKELPEVSEVPNLLEQSISEVSLASAVTQDAAVKADIGVAEMPGDGLILGEQKRSRDEVLGVQGDGRVPQSEKDGFVRDALTLRDGGEAGSEGAESLLWDSPTRKRTRIRRALVRLRYVFIGAVVGTAILSALVMYRVLRSPESVEEFRQSLQAKSRFSTVGMGQSEASVGLDARRDLASYREMSSRSLLPGDWAGRSDFYARGVPFAFYTLPAEATIYIVEGVYRALESKHFLLVAGQDTEVAIQAPGYETCFYRVHFDREGSTHFDSIQGSGCASMETTFSMRTGRVEVFVGLASIRAVRTADEKRMELESSKFNAEISDTSEEVSSRAIQGSAGARGDGIEAEVQGARRSGESDKDGRKGGEAVGRGRGRLSSKGSKALSAQEKSRAEARLPEILSFGVRSNRRAMLISGGESCELPCELPLEKGSAYEVKPFVKGRQIGIPYAGVAQVGGALRVEFCQLTVRIRESFVPGDPAPYQVADIAIGDRVYARQSDRGVFILPCGKYAVRAQIDTESGRLEGQMEVDLTDGSQAYIQSMQLSL